MGQLFNSQVSYTDDIVKFKEKDNYDSYSRFLENAPIFVDYYRQSTTESTTDVGFDNAYDRTGDGSPIRYNKIIDMPIYGIDKESLNIDDGDAGITASLLGEGVIVPNLIEPIADDLFEIEYMDKHILFRVTDVNVDTIKSNNFYKISFKFDKYNYDDIEKQVVDTYRCIFDNIGTQFTSIVKNNDYIEIEKLKELYSNLRENYLDNFYAHEYNSLIYKLPESQDSENDVYLYDPYLTGFIIKNTLFFEQLSFKCVNLMIECSVPRYYNELYLNSIYHMVESKNKTLQFINNYTTLPIQEYSSVFSGRYDRFVSISLKSKYDGANPIFNMEYITINDLYTNIQNNKLYEDNSKTSLLYNVIIKYMNDTNNHDLMEYILDQLNDYYCEYTKDNMVGLPIVLFIIRKIINTILIKDF